MQAIAELIAHAISALFSLFGNFDISPLVVAIETMTPYFKMALYILPANTIRQIFNVIIMFWSYRLCVNAVKTIWNLLPIA